MSRSPRTLGLSVGKLAIIPVLALLAALAVRGQDRPEPLSPTRAQALDTIRADSLRGHLAFLASDLLEGRDTPSRGLDIAAEYIASQFRRAGLEPAGDDGYFQSAHWKVVESEPASFHFTIQVGDAAFSLPLDRVSLAATRKIVVRDVGLVKAPADNLAELKTLDPGEVEGRALVVEQPKIGGKTREERSKEFQARIAWREALSRLKPGLLVELDRSTPEGGGLDRGRLIDPEQVEGFLGGLRLDVERIPQITIHDPAVIAALDALPTGPVAGSATLELGMPVAKPVVLKNVAGLLRGSDPELKDEYVIVSGHYDHLGTTAPGRADRIYNGANDDASGTVMVVELASALAKVEPGPKRSILFLTFFGEEKGLLGSRYYGRHPLVPLSKTVAHVNLEQVGRTDDREGPQVGRASLTGFDFSEVGAILRDAGRATGVEVFKHPRNSAAFFSRSDNQALADLGIPAHTLCVAYLFPDYHEVGDHWDKIDYANMARVARTVGLGLLMIADRPEPPRWNAENPNVELYRKAWEKLHGADEAN